MLSIVWETHALPLYWELIEHPGSSDLSQQKSMLKAILPLFKNKRFLVLGDQEFHSPKLAKCLDRQGICFVLCQKKSLYMQERLGEEYQAIKNLGFKPGMSQFYERIFCNKTDQIGPFNLAIYWKRKYRGKGPKDPWYILTNLPTLKQTLDIYKCRWGIEQMFKDCKTSGYNLEDTKANDTRFLALVLIIAITYSLTTMQGQWLQKVSVEHYICRLQEYQNRFPRHSNFGMGLYGYRWVCAMLQWSEWALKLMALKPHKRLYFQRGFKALSLIQQAF